METRLINHYLNQELSRKHFFPPAQELQPLTSDSTKSPERKVSKQKIEQKLPKYRTDANVSTFSMRNQKRSSQQFAKPQQGISEERTIRITIIREETSLVWKKTLLSSTANKKTSTPVHEEEGDLFINAEETLSRSKHRARERRGIVLRRTAPRSRPSIGSARFAEDDSSSPFPFSGAGRFLPARGWPRGARTLIDTYVAIATYFDAAYRLRDLAWAVSVLSVNIAAIGNVYCVKRSRRSDTWSRRLLPFHARDRVFLFACPAPS